MQKIGISGGIGSGKSTVARFFQEKGACVFDADTVAKELLDSDLSLQEAIVREFGRDILSPEGFIIKEKLARRAFANPIKQQKLNNIVHPAVFNKLMEDFNYIQKLNRYTFFVVDAPLLFEAGWYKHMDYNILVYTPEKIRLERALKRGKHTLEDIKSRMKLQMPEEVKKQLADFVITNSSTLEELQKQVNSLIEQLRLLS